MTTRTDPSLIQRILSDNAHQGLIVPTQVLVHTAVDGPGPTNLGSYFENHTNLESHTWLRWAAHEQFIWFDRSADANYKVNRWWNPTNKRYEGAISIETEDDGSPVMNPWNSYQINELIRFIAWCCKEFNIPPRLARSVHDPGLGWHAMFPGQWTNVPGKTCPGPTRIKQFTDIVLPGVVKALAPPKPKPTGDDLVIRIQTFKGAASLPAGQKGVGAKYKVISGKDQGGQTIDFTAIHLDEGEYNALKYVGLDEAAGSITVTEDIKRICTFVGGPFNTV